ncbi:MAG: hypothetical protein ACR2QB_11980 [Gammaproteobacteria bacterium]|jgi:hypothetical protein
MRKKFYTRFLMRSEDEGFSDEYSGVVEVSAPQDQVLDPIEIEVLLAKNFQMEADDIELLNWSRLH